MYNHIGDFFAYQFPIDNIKKKKFYRFFAKFIAAFQKVNIFEA